MTKAELVATIAEKGQTTKKHANDGLELIFGALAEALVAGEEIAIPVFGKFSVVTWKARTGMNPQTKKTIKIPETKAPKFSSAKALKDSVK